VTVFAGHYGSIELKRIGGPFTLDLEIRAQDISAGRKRFALSTKEGQDIPFGTITTGDRIRIATNDSRGLPFRFYTNSENSQFIDDPGSSVGPLEFFANVDTMGAIRMYRTFGDAIANSGQRYLAIPLDKAAGSTPWPVTITLLPGAFNTLGKVTGFTLSTERENVDITSLGDRYRGVSASAISGSGSVDCLFEFKNVAFEEVPSALADLIQKVEIGSQFEGKFYLLAPVVENLGNYNSGDSAYYQVRAMITRSSLVVNSDAIVECSFDFVTTGQFEFKTGVSPVAITTESDISIVSESTLEALGTLLELD
jgi:hypothetical protein